MSFDEISIVSGLKKPVLSKYLKKLIEHGDIEKASYGMYCAKHARREEKAGLKELSVNNQSGCQ